MSIRDVELVLLANGGAELVDLNEEKPIWASDSDDNFREQFRELLAEKDVDDILNYLVSEEIITDDEADVAEVSAEDAQGDERPKPGDEEDEDEYDFDEDEAEAHLNEFVTG